MTGCVASGGGFYVGHTLTSGETLSAPTLRSLGPAAKRAKGCSSEHEERFDLCLFWLPHLGDAWNGLGAIVAYPLAYTGAAIVLDVAMMLPCFAWGMWSGAEHWCAAERPVDSGDEASSGSDAAPGRPAEEASGR